jgi:hypothetical protein
MFRPCQAHIALNHHAALSWIIFEADKLASLRLAAIFSYG